MWASHYLGFGWRPADCLEARNAKAFALLPRGRRAMNYPDNIAELESLLERVSRIVGEDERAVSRSERPNVDLLFLCSSKKLRSDLQKRLGIAKQNDLGKSLGFGYCGIG